MDAPFQSLGMVMFGTRQVNKEKNELIALRGHLPEMYIELLLPPVDIEERML